MQTVKPGRALDGCGQGRNSLLAEGLMTWIKMNCPLKSCKAS